MPPDALRRRLTPLPPSPDAEAALIRLREAAGRSGVREAIDAALGAPELAGFLGTTFGDCPYLLDLAVKDPGRVVAILEGAPETRIDAQLAAIGTAEWQTRADVMSGLRKVKQDIALTLGLADLARAVPLEFVTGSLAGFADAALQRAIAFALAEGQRSGKWAGGEAAKGFVVLALGKHGAQELNYSSDIDIIALFDPEAHGLAEGVEPSTFWVRIVRLVVALLQERTADGYVFRTDLRLRPDPGATPVALSAPAALLYYESMGQNWERAALIKARPAAGDLAAGAAFLQEIGPFIWRKYLDFAAIADIHSIKRQVHAHRGHADVRVRGHDIKRGRGGIREIEFFVQTQQLIAGGRDASLRGRETRAMLARLNETGWINSGARRALDTAYVFLRDVEHRLQMVCDEQTHTMPTEAEGIARIGRLMGFAEADAFEADLRSVLESVARRYSELFEDAPELSTGAGSLVFTGADDDPATLETLRQLGFQEPTQATAAVRAWHFGRFPAMRSRAAREGLTEITPALMEAFARAGNPDAALRAFDSLLKALPAGAQLFALLTNNRQLLDLLATILGAAPRLADIFARRPHVVDALLDPASIHEAPDLAGQEARLGAALAQLSSHEDILDGARRFAAEQRFLISIGFLNGRLDAQQTGLAFAELAEAVLRALFAQTRKAFERAHGSVTGGQSAVLAFGRLGSREMTAGSDLDLIVIYDHAEDAAPSNGPRPLPPSQYYTRLTQRLTAALAAPTGEGVAYAVDLRLRPSGRSGPLATRFEAFQRYQMEEAWTWEILALSRGRAVAGDAALMLRVEALLDTIVAVPRDRRKIAADVAEMRERIEREKPAANAFDVKLARGGLMDCEFAAQVLVLAGLGRRAGEPTPATLRRAAAAGAVDRVAGERLGRAAALQSALFQTLRIADDKPFTKEAAPDALKRLLARVAQHASGASLSMGASSPSFDDLTVQLEEVQRDARAALETVLGQPVGPR